MIDIEPMVFEAVRNAVSPVMCSPTYQDRSKVFPLVTVEEYDNSVYEKTQDSGNYENHAKLLYEVNVYSNLTSGKKAQAKEIMKKVDVVMAKMGFVRSYCSPTPNLSDSNVYRITARYKAIADKEQNIYWR
jgi:hypothetical protein